jgi:hypothetical protein
MDIGTFRQVFTEFSDTSKYPDDAIEFWAAVAELQVLETVWKNLRTQGVMLYVAHELVLASQNVSASKVGGTPGLSGGIPNTKTVGSVTVGYDSQNTSEKDAGWWNLTTYGKQFIRLARIFGAGAIQL